MAAATPPPPLRHLVLRISAGFLLRGSGPAFALGRGVQESSATGGPYRPRDAQRGVLFQAVRDHLRTFLVEAEQGADARGVPGFVRRELERFTRCGVLARFRCKECRHDRLVPFSCKGRGFCPSCTGRRMTERAAHLVDRVLPRVPVRQWVLSLPFELRYRLTFDHELCLAVVRIFTRALLGHFRGKARARGVPNGRGGSVTVIQRAGSALNLNIHFHTLAPDGVFAEDETGRLRFVRVPAPTDAEVASLLEVARSRVLRMLDRRGVLAEGEQGEPVLDDDPDGPPLADLYAASVQQLAATGPRAGQKLLRLRTAAAVPQTKRRARRQAHLGGFDLHADTFVPAHDRRRLERVCRYVLRPPIAERRLGLSAGKVTVELKRPWRDGSTHLLLEPTQLIEKLAVLVPRPGTNQILYHGVLAANARWRPQVVAYGRPAPSESGSASAEAPKRPNMAVAVPTEVDERSKSMQVHGYRPVDGSERTLVNPTFADLMRRGLDIDVLDCPRCGGRLRFIAAILEPAVVRRILDHLGLPSEPVRLRPARAPPDLEDDAVA